MTENLSADDSDRSLRKTVVVSRRAAARLATGFPWVFESDVEAANGAESGSVVAVTDGRNKQLGVAHFSSSSQIRLRLLDHKARSIDRQFFRERISAALEFRQRYVRDTDAFRVIHAEADGLPALVVDRYSDYLSVQLLNQGMDAAAHEILDVLQELINPKAIVLRNDASVRDKEQLPREVRVGRGELSGPVAFQMNGLKWEVDLLEGQKTGGFLDQRTNYSAAARFAKGKGEALDCYTNSGGFAMHLARVCQRVEAADSSAKAIAAAESNAKRNELEIGFRQADVADLLRGLNQARRRFDVVVLDPPAFAKSRSAVTGALKAYYDINQRALRMLNPGGILVTCSCSQHVSEADLLGVISEAASETGKFLRVLDRRTQSEDHPILLAVPETLYLKCLIFEVLA